MDLNESQRQYLICKTRGHQPSGMVMDTYPPYETCKYCGTTYRYVTSLDEARTPFGWITDLRQNPHSEAAKLALGENGHHSSD